MSPNVIPLPCRLTLGCRSNVLAVAVLAALTGAAAFAAPAISGTYADKGVVVQTAGAATPASVSFHGLLSQEFDPDLARLNFDETSHVTLQDEAGVHTLEIFNQAQERIWRARWGAQRGYSHEGDQAVLRMRMRGTTDERCVLVMEATPDRRGLLVEVHHVKPSTFGPHSNPIGTYMFVRTD